MRIKANVKHPQVENFGGAEILIEDWWDRVSGCSWMLGGFNPACLVYGIRSADTLPLDDEVLYGKIAGFGHIVHISELEIDE